MTEETLKNMEPADLLNALMSDNTLASEFDRLELWGKLYSISWSHLLKTQPHFIDKAKGYSHGWAGLLAIKPDLAQECRCWKEFDSLDWVDLLRFQPQFANKCNKWEAFDGWNWRDLLKSQPQFVDKYNKYDGWEKMDSENWCKLLKSQPQFQVYAVNHSPDSLVQKVEQNRF